jgi:hypothetical protein
MLETVSLTFLLQATELESDNETAAEVAVDTVGMYLVVPGWSGLTMKCF